MQVGAELYCPHDPADDSQHIRIGEKKMPEFCSKVLTYRPTVVNSHVLAVW